MSVDVVPNDAEQSEDLEVLLLDEDEVILLPKHLLSQILYQYFIDKVFDDELVAPEHLLKKVEVAWLVLDDDVLDDEVDPLGNINFEE